MKKIYFFMITALLMISANAQDLIITGVFDGPLSGGTPKGAELYVVNDIADLSAYGIGTANNGDPSQGVEFQFSGSASAGDFLYVATEETQFNAFFGFNPDFTTNVMAINGDDAVELFGNVADNGGTLVGTVIDVYGDVGTDGTGEAWDHLDGWAYRVDGRLANNGTFDANDFTYSGVDGLDGATSNATATTPFPIGTYATTANTNPEITVSEPSNGMLLMPGTTSTEVVFSTTNIDLSTDGNQVDITVNGTKTADVSSPFTAILMAGDNTILVELLENNMVVDSQTMTVTVVVSTEVADIAALRAGTTGEIYTLTGEAYLTYIQSFRNQKYFEDATGAVLIDDTDGTLDGDFEIGDGITGLIGRLNEFGGTIQFDPLFDIDPSSEDNEVAPQTVTYAELSANAEDYESELVTVSGVTFDDNSGSFETGTVYPTTDPSGSFDFRTSFFDADYIGEEVPDNAVTITGIINERSDGYYITAREMDGLMEIEVNFEETVVQVVEGIGAAYLKVILSAPATKEITIPLQLISESDDMPIPANVVFSEGDTEKLLPITNIQDNDEMNIDKFIAIEILESEGVTLGDDYIGVLYILDNERHVAEAADVLGMEYTSTLSGLTGAEIVAHDPTSQKLFVSNSGDNQVTFIDFSDPTNMSILASPSFEAYGEEVTSVAVHDGLVAVAVSSGDQTTPGKVVFHDTDGNILASVNVGNLPDMVTFTPDGTMALVACEGEPNDDYDVDPEGTVALIDLTGDIASLTDANVTLLNFNAFDEDLADLRAAGVRIFGPGATVSQDLEPEYITVSADSRMAYVSLQENNAYAIVNLETPEITDIIPFGYKDHNLEMNAFDSSNRIDSVAITTWNTYGMYQPDAIAAFEMGGKHYMITANEGDARDYDGFSEEERVEDLNLDPTAYPNADFLQMETVLGRLNVTTATGDTDGDGDIDQIYSYGARSFSIWDLDNNTMVYDSGDWLERIIEEDPEYGQIFNATNDENAYKNRSDDKGPEPEAVIVEMIEGEMYAFVGLERIGGVAAFNISDPMNPVFEKYVNNRDNTVDAEDNLGDLAPEGVIYVAPDENSTNKGLIVVANEESFTISVYTLQSDDLSVDPVVAGKNGFRVYPNPANGERVFFSKPLTYVLYDLQGRKVAEDQNAAYLNVSQMATGTYILKADTGAAQKLIVE